MAKRLYADVNYIIKEDVDGNLLDYPKKHSFMTERSGAFVVRDSANDTEFTITYLDASNYRDGGGLDSQYTTESLRVFLRTNTGS